MPQTSSPQYWVLWDDCQPSSEIVQPDFRHVLIVDLNFTFGRLDYSEQSQGERGFSCSCSSNDAHLFAGVYCYVDVFDYQVEAFAVPSTVVFKGHFSCCRPFIG